jgi:hypothetical protein
MSELRITLVAEGVTDVEILRAALKTVLNDRSFIFALSPLCGVAVHSTR